jgi:hypothetical protein
MSEFKASGFRDEFGSDGPDLVGITTFTSPYYFVPPSGTTAERPSDPAPGMLRFNTDIGRLEVWRNNHWATILGESLNLGNQNVSNSAGGTGTRAVFAGGYNAGSKNHMDYVTVDTLGNAQDFGDLATSKLSPAGYSSRVFGYSSGSGPAAVDIERFVFASTGNATDVGDLSVGRGYCMGLSNSTRGIVCAGNSAPTSPSGTNIIDYHSLAEGGTAVDFGNLTNANLGSATCASSVRGICTGGSFSPNYYANIDYITISTTGDAQDFGDLSTGRSQFGCCFSNATRGVMGGGITAPAPATPLNITEFITIASTGNAQDFGDLSRTNTRHAASACSSTRGVFAGGDPHASPYPKSNQIDFLTIPTTGNSLDFGDLANQERNHFSGCSTGHGGL